MERIKKLHDTVGTLDTLSLNCANCVKCAMQIFTSLFAIPVYRYTVSNSLHPLEIS